MTELTVPVTFTQPASERQSSPGAVKPPQMLNVSTNSIAAYKYQSGQAYEIFLKEGELPQFKNWSKQAVISAEAAKTLGLK